jgi:hypothetical protein
MSRDTNRMDMWILLLVRSRYDLLFVGKSKSLYPVLNMFVSFAACHDESTLRLHNDLGSVAMTTGDLRASRAMYGR